MKERKKDSKHFTYLFIFCSFTEFRYYTLNIKKIMSVVGIYTVAGLENDWHSFLRIVELHPALAEAANHIAAAVHEDAMAATPSSQPTTSSGYSYSLDALSDDDEMDSSQVRTWKKDPRNAAKQWL